MNRFKEVSLRQLLTVPYVALLLALAAVIAGLSYRAGSLAVTDISGKLLDDMSRRIQQAVQLHLVGSRVALDAVAPDGVGLLVSEKLAVDSIVQSLWVATGLHPDPNNYVYYGSEKGEFIGVLRHGVGKAELRLKRNAADPRGIYQLSHPLARPKLESIEKTIYDPRSRPWYKEVVDRKAPAWAPIYVDFRTSDLVTTRAKPVFDDAGKLHGILATDISLKQLSDFLSTLPVSANGVAFLMEADGNLIALSNKESAFRTSGNSKVRLHASLSTNEVVREAYRGVAPLLAAQSELPGVTTLTLDTSSGRLHLAVSQLKDVLGLNWYSVVAVPQRDVMGNITETVAVSAALALIAAGIALVFGLLLLNWVARDLQALATAAERVMAGQRSQPIPIRMRGEIGKLARTFEAMHTSVQTDRLTGALNREMIQRQVSHAMEEHRRNLTSGHLCLLFIDLNHFKLVNDQHGHDLGDQVLIEVARRLQKLVRSQDLVARYGGDEFVVLLPEIPDIDTARAVVGKIAASFEEQLPCLATIGSSLSVGAAIGLALYPGDGDDLDSLIRAADRDMYRNKAKSRT